MEGFLLVFDLDGTLVDSVPDLRAALNEMLRERGRRPLSPLEVKRMVGDGVPTLVARALTATGADPGEAATALPRFLEIYEANAADLTRPYPGVPETVTALRRRGYRTAICTNKPQRATLAVLQGRQRKRRGSGSCRRRAARADALRLRTHRPRIPQRGRAPRPLFGTTPGTREARPHSVKCRSTPRPRSSASSAVNIPNSLPNSMRTGTIRSPGISRASHSFP